MEYVLGAVVVFVIFLILKLVKPKIHPKFNAETVRDMISDNLIDRIVTQASVFGKTELVESEFPGVEMVDYLESVGFTVGWKVPGKEYVISWAEED